MSAVALGISSARRTVVTLKYGGRGPPRFSVISAKLRSVWVQAADPLALFLLPLFQPQARAATVLVNEFDAGGFERALDDIKGRPPRLMTTCLKLPYGDYTHSSFVGEFCLAPVEDPREADGKMRETSGSWDGEKVILRDQVLEIRNVDGRLHVARKARKPDEWDPPIAAYDPYGPDNGPEENRGGVTCHTTAVTRHLWRKS